jgi:hypothetical protein
LGGVLFVTEGDGLPHEGGEPQQQDDHRSPRFIWEAM